MDRTLASRHQLFVTRTHTRIRPRRQHRAMRTALSVGAVGAGLLLSACTTTTYNCSNSTCEVSLRGEGASSDLGGERDTVTLVAVDDGVATIELAGQRGSCSSGETIEIGQASVECTEVASDGVDLTITG